MRAMILAAGLGTRLAPLTLELPKPAVPLANRPLASFAVEALTLERAPGPRIDAIAINTHPMPERLERALAPYLPRAVRTRFFREESVLGTGGGLRNARAFLLDGDPDAPVVAANADMLFAPDLGAALDAHERYDAIATMVLRPDPEGRYGEVRIGADGLVDTILGRARRGSVGRPAARCMFTGVHLLSRRAFDDLPERGCVIRTAYFAWLERGERIAAVVDPSPWQDLGTVADYVDAGASLAGGTLRWEQFTEYTSYTFDRPLPAGAAAFAPLADDPVGRDFRPPG